MRRKTNPPKPARQAFRSQVQYDVWFDAGPHISAPKSIFDQVRAQIEARNGLVKGLRDHKFAGTGYYTLTDVGGATRQIFERSRLSSPTADNAKWHWVDENHLIGSSEPASVGPKVKIVEARDGPKKYAIEARLETGELVAAIVLEEDRAACAVRNRLLKAASHGYSVGAWHVVKAVFHPDHTKLKTTMFVKALNSTTHAGMASGLCADGSPVNAAGYDPKEIFESVMFQAMANVQEHDGYYVAYRRV